VLNFVFACCFSFFLSAFDIAPFDVFARVVLAQIPAEEGEPLPPEARRYQNEAFRYFNMSKETLEEFLQLFEPDAVERAMNIALSRKEEIAI